MTTWIMAQPQMKYTFTQKAKDMSAYLCDHLAKTKDKNSEGTYTEAKKMHKKYTDTTNLHHVEN